MPKLDQHKVRLEKIIQLSSSVRTFCLRDVNGKPFVFQAGQFCMVHVPEDGGVKKKAYSIASGPEQTETIELCIKLVQGGLATEWFWTLKQGDEFDLSSPYGRFVLPEGVNEELIFVATGTGLAPFRSMIHHLYHDGASYEKDVWLIFGVRYENEILYHDEWLALAQKNPHFHYIPTISRPKNWDGAKGYVQERLKESITDPGGKKVYICGLVPMVEAVNQAAQQIGFSKDQIHFEKYV
jgi:ferredoxin-NADP reductase